MATWLFPPAGLLLLWRSSQVGLTRKILGSVLVGLYSLLYTAAILYLLYRFCGLQVEFRGGLVPRLTFHKTVPDYAALESSRTRQKLATTRAASPIPAATNGFWPGFRGASRDGRSEEQPNLERWPPGGPRLLWRQPIGGGYASFAVANSHAYTIEQRRQQEAATAYDVETGRELWRHGWDAEFKETLGGDGPRATPAYDNGRIYALGALGEFRCLDSETGHLLWRRNIIEENGAPELTYGVASSPLIVDDKVIVTPGGHGERSVVAYHKITGERVWGSLNDQAAYSSPMLVELASQRQLLVVTRDRAVGLEMEKGRLLWEFPWKVLQGNRNIAQPVLLSTNRLFLSAGYGTGCVALQVDRTEAGFAVRELWRNKLLKNKFTSSVFYQGCLYGLDEDILTCLDAATGERKWKEGRYGYGQMLLVGDNLVILSGSGELVMVQAAPGGSREVSRFQAIHGKTWNHPALAGSRLLVRNAAEMAAFEGGMQRGSERAGK